MAKIKGQTIPSVGEDAEQPELWNTAGENIKWCSHFGKLFSRDFPGGAVVKTPCSQCRGPGFNPWSGN